jgi:hypothetical protein
MGRLSNNNGDRKQLTLKYQLLPVRHRRKKARQKSSNWDSRSKRPNKKPMVTVGLDPPRMRKNKQYLGSKRPDTKTRVTVGVEQTTENTAEIHFPTKTDLGSSEISPK